MSNINVWEYYVKNDFKILIDTCSLMDEGFSDAYILQLEEALRKYHRRICIPEKVKAEVRYHAQDTINIPKAKRADRAWQIISRLDKGALIDVDTTGMDTPGRFADPALLSIINSNMAAHRILLVTQDINLSRDVLKTNESRSVMTRGIFVKRFTNGRLVDFRPMERRSANPHTEASVNKTINSPSAPAAAGRTGSRAPSQNAPTARPAIDYYKYVDEANGVTVEGKLKKGDGIFKKAFRKDLFYNFKLYVNTSKPLKRISAYINGGAENIKIPISLGKDSSVSFKRSDVKGTLLKVTVEFEYKIGLLKVKSGRFSISMNI